MARRMNKMEKECMNRLNEVIETGDYISGLIQDVATGRTTFVDERLTDISNEYGQMTYLKNEHMIGVGKIIKIFIQ